MNESDVMQVREKIRNELKPYVDGIILGKAILPEFDYHIFRLRWEAFRIIWLKLTGFDNIENLNTENIARDLFAYVGFVESAGATLIDFIIMLIIANGVDDLHIESYDETPRIRHVKSIADLKKVPLATKLNFLRDNKIKEIPSLIDRNLRNDIAHMSFELDGENIRIRGQPIQNRITEGMEKLNALFFVYDELLRVDPLKRKVDT